MRFEVLVTNSRGPETLSDLAAETGATAASVTKAVRGVDLIVVTIPEKIFCITSDNFSLSEPKRAGLD
jgi:predicted dinucleotide-binding enzyme